MDADVVVIGAGVVGLAIAARLAEKRYSVILLEKESKFGTGISSRNSEVIHAGIYYKTDSLKATLCLKGKVLMYDHCKKYNVAYKKIGKLFLAIGSDEISRLEQTQNQAKINGVEDLLELNQKELKRIEPELSGSGALLSPSSGIIDSHSFMKSLLSLAENNKAIFAPLSPVENAEPINGGWKIYIGGNEPTSITSNLVINSTGLNAISLSKKIFPTRKFPKFFPTKGSYLRYSGKSPLQHIVYPSIIPGKIEERVDATPDLGGSLRFGPNVEEVEDLEDFSMKDEIIQQMLPGIKRYLPNIDASRLNLDIAGIRPKIYRKDGEVADFRFELAEDNRWLDLWGMESPALTASLAIAEYVRDIFHSRQIIN
jgi:L-2-hydroxyglutarate oxidase LhgO